MGTMAESSTLQLLSVASSFLMLGVLLSPKKGKTQARSVGHQV